MQGSLWEVRVLAAHAVPAWPNVGRSNPGAFHGDQMGGR